MTHRFYRTGALSLVLSTLALVAGAGVARAQVPEQQGIMFNVQAANQRLEMIVNTSRILTLDQKIPTAQVGNRDLLDLTALSPTQIQVFAKKAGVTQINLWNERNEIRTVDVVVYGDSRELKLVLQSQFPRSSLTVTPLSNSVIIGGYVDGPDQVSRIIRIAEDYHPNIINNITVGGVQQVLLDVKVMEVSRTRMRALGMDFAHFSGNDMLVSSVSGLITSFSQAQGSVTTSGARSLSFGVVNPNSSFFGVIEALSQKDVAKVLADPKLVTVSGRPARFLQGGEFPVLVPQSLGTVSIEYRPYGTELDFVPVVLGNGLIRLELRPRVSEPDPSLSVTINNTTVPALTIREVDTGVEMRAGQTLAIAGLVQTRVQTQVKGLPWISDLPYVGALFSRKQSRENEVETLILVTPHLVEAMDCGEVPPCGPGGRTDVPNDWELYLKGYVEVPKCCPPEGGPMGPGPMPGPLGPGHEGAAVPYSQPYPGMTVPRGIEELAPQPPAAPGPPMNRAAPSDRSAPVDPMVPSVPPPEVPKVDVPGLDLNSPQARRGATPATAASQTRAPQPPAAVRRATPPQGVPVHTTSTGSSNRYQASNPPEPRSRAADDRAPGFIGPTGYDVE